MKMQKPVAALDLKEAVRVFEIEYFTFLPIEHRGDIADIAQAAGFEHSNLYRKLKQLGIGDKVKLARQGKLTAPQRIHDFLLHSPGACWKRLGKVPLSAILARQGP